MRYHTITLFLPKKERAVVSYAVQRLLKDGLRPYVEELDDYLLDRVHYPAGYRPKDFILLSVHTAATPTMEIQRLMLLGKEVKRCLKKTVYLSVDNNLLPV
jgi:hypothetical protein